MSNDNRDGLLQDPNSSSNTGSSWGGTDESGGNLSSSGSLDDAGATATYNDIDAGTGAGYAGGTGGSTGDENYSGSTTTGSIGGTGMSFDPNQIQHGWDVYGADGEKVGDVSEVGTNYLLVTKGWLFPKDRYVPLDAITGLEHDRVYLNVGKDQIDSLGWDEPPTADAGYTSSGIAYDTQTADYPSSGDMSVDTGTTNDQAFITQSTQDVQYQDTSATAARTDTTQVTGDETIRVPRYEEELTAQRVGRQAGEVSIEKDVIEEQRTIEVPTTREEIRVESRAVDRPMDASTGDAFQEGTIDVPLYEEDVEVSKQARVVEELEISKQQVQDTERVTDTVRREEVRIDDSSNMNAGSTGFTTDTDFTTDTTRR